MPLIIKVSLQSRICYDSQASLSRFMFVYASLSILTMGIFPLSKNVMVPFMHGKKNTNGRKMPNRSDILD